MPRKKKSVPLKSASEISEKVRIADTCILAIELGHLRPMKHQLCDLLDVLDKDQTDEFKEAAAALRAALGGSETCTESANIYHGLIYLKICDVTDLEPLFGSSSKSNPVAAEKDR